VKHYTVFMGERIGMRRDRDRARDRVSERETVVRDNTAFEISQI
jgi:hypothetical protein